MLPGTNLSNFLGVITNRQGRKLLVAQMGSILRSISLYPMDTNSIQNKDSCLSDGGSDQKCLSRVHPIQKFSSSGGGADQKCLNGIHLNKQISALDGPVTDRPNYYQIS